MYRNLSRLRGIQSRPFLMAPQPGKVAVHFQRRVRNKRNETEQTEKRAVNNPFPSIPPFSVCCRSMNTHQNITIDQFTRQAESYSQSPGHTNEESLRLLVELAEISGDDTVLDVACGTGMVACAFAAVVRQVTGIDITPAMLEQAGLLAERQGLTNLSWRQG